MLRGASASESLRNMLSDDVKVCIFPFLYHSSRFVFSIVPMPLPLHWKLHEPTTTLFADAWSLRQLCAVEKMKCFKDKLAEQLQSRKSTWSALTHVSGLEARKTFWNAVLSNPASKRMAAQRHTIFVSKTDWTGIVQTEKWSKLEISAHDFVVVADRYGEETTDRSTLATALMIHEALKLRKPMSLHDDNTWVLNLASVAEKLDFDSLRIVYNLMKNMQKQHGRAKFEFAEVLQEIGKMCDKLSTHTSYNARWHTDPTWSLKTFVKDLRDTPNKFSTSLNGLVSSYDLLTYANAQFQSAGHLAVKTIMYKVNTYLYVFGGSVPQLLLKSYFFNTRNTLLNSSSHPHAMKENEEKIRGYFSSSGTRLTVPLLTGTPAVGIYESKVNTQEFYSNQLFLIRKTVLCQWKKRGIIGLLRKGFPMPKQSLTYAMCEYRMRLVQLLREQGVPCKKRVPCKEIQKSVRKIGTKPKKIAFSGKKKPAGATSNRR